MTIRDTEALFRRFADDCERKAQQHPRDSNMGGWYAGKAAGYRFVARNLWNCLAGNVTEAQTPGSLGNSCEWCPAAGGGCAVCVDTAVVRIAGA